MARFNFDSPLTLDELIDRYALNKSEFDSYKKLVDSDNAEIKRLMHMDNVTEYSTNNYTAKYIVSNRESIDEDKLLSVCKQFDIPDVVQTKEYVNMDAFENFMYNTDVSEELLSAIDSCRISKEVVTLRISTNKNKEN